MESSVTRRVCAPPDGLASPAESLGGFVAETMKHSLVHDASVAQVLDDDALEQRGSDPRIPDALGVHDDDRTTRADTETGRLAALHASRAEEQPLALKQTRQQSVERSSLAVWRAVAADADQNVARVRLHESGELGGARRLWHGGAVCERDDRSLTGTSAASAESAAIAGLVDPTESWTHAPPLARPTRSRYHRRCRTARRPGPLPSRHVRGELGVRPAAPDAGSARASRCGALVPRPSTLRADARHWTNVDR